MSVIGGGAASFIHADSVGRDTPSARATCEIDFAARAFSTASRLNASEYTRRPRDFAAFGAPTACS
ncbi:hypothetical protein [Microbacterium sp. KR10-403]|uniref:hypothetical protein n=1 Tax=Microbacterium sp. KR10-403 TaxID=3158581 RepID=UPI0032E3761F